MSASVQPAGHVHPWIHQRKKVGPPTHAGAMQGPMTWLAIKITGAVGTMYCAIFFALIALVSLPDAIHGGRSTIISWIAQTFIQLVLLSIIMVGQNISSVASDARALATYNDADAILHTVLETQGMVRQMLEEQKPVATWAETPPPLSGQIGAPLP
jgi:hypothetical protein